MNTRQPVSLLFEHNTGIKQKSNCIKPYKKLTTKFKFFNPSLLNITSQKSLKLAKNIFEPKHCIRISLHASFRKMVAVVAFRNKNILFFSTGIIGRTRRIKKTLIIAEKLAFDFSKIFKELMFKKSFRLKKILILKLKGRRNVLRTFMRNLYSEGVNFKPNNTSGRNWRPVIIKLWTRLSAFNGVKKRKKKRKRRSVSRRKKKNSLCLT